MSDAPIRLPGFWRFVWLFFMQPVTLHRLLRSVGVDPGALLFWKLLRGRASPAARWWVDRSILGALLFILVAASALNFTLGPVVNGRPWAAGVVGGAALGVALGMAAYLGIGMTGMANRLAYGGVELGAPLGAALLSVVAGAVTGGVAYGMAAGIAIFATSLATFLRVPILVLEMILQSVARGWNAITDHRSLPWSPVLYHELSYVPHPFLEGHILVEADSNPVLTRRVLDACAIAPGQRRTGRKVEAKLRASELKRLVEAKDFQAIAQLRGFWLPGIQGADSLLLSFSEAGRYLVAARAVFNPHYRLKHLQGLLDQVRAIENQLRAERNVFTQPFEEPLRALRNTGLEMQAEAEKTAAGLIPNPFRAGNPLSGEEGPELFRGREDAVKDIEEILSDPHRTASLLLLAPRRAGKTSLLKMLPRMLPDTVCVFFDLQAHPVASVGAFWSKLAEQAAIQAKRERRIDLPALPNGPPIEAAAAWLEKLDQLTGGRRVLIAIDEFERLEDLFPGSRQEFLQLMGLFRATIQHRTGVRLLVSGAAPFDELDRVWDDHFISTRQIRLPFLDSPTSVGLLTQPSPEFPAGTIPEEVAHEVYQRTGGQPYLLQVFGSLLVSRLNDEKRTVANQAGVRAVEGRVIEWAESYFRDTYKSAPEAAREAFSRLSQGEPANLTPTARRWLAQRYLLTPDDRLSVPVFGAWIEHHALV